MDFNKLRSQAMQAGEDEEAVTVNTRALIDKVLARYSGEHTTLRELIQNAADANATTVKIRFETLPSSQVPLSNTTNPSETLKHVLLHHTLRRLLVSNDGTPFGASDWSRLKRIAEGNPDETKIGAFGVGFYSVFADCEEPLVSSGQEALAFYWKGNSLFTRKLQLKETSPETSFVLDYRNTTSHVPNLLGLCQFLATSLTFVAIQNIELWIDDWRILSLQKKAALSVPYPIPKHMETKTKEGYMKVHSLAAESVQMDATFVNAVGWKPPAASSMFGFGENSYGQGTDSSSLRSFFSRLTSTASQANARPKLKTEEKPTSERTSEDLVGTQTAHVFLSVTTGTIRTTVPAVFATELERATKKPPPKETKLAILSSSFDEIAASQTATAGTAPVQIVDIFGTVLPGKKPSGRIFIGFPTHQTTGVGLHLSAPSVIPTVERESIDLNARWVRTWNIELLRAAGIITRLTFSKEMAELDAKVKRVVAAGGEGNKLSKETVLKFIPEAIHILQTFTFSESTPSSQVSAILEEAFWTTHQDANIEIYSSRGVFSTASVRMATEDHSGFVEGIPVIPKELIDIPFVKKLVYLGLLTDITIGDVKKELNAKALTKDQLIQLISWAGKKAVSGSVERRTLLDLIENTVAMIGETESQGEILELRTIKFFRNPNRIPPEMPVSSDTLSYELTRTIPEIQLKAIGWEPLEVVPWLRFLTTSVGNRNGLDRDHDITNSPAFSARVLAVVSKSWDTFSASSKETVQNLLRPLPVIPTKLGMKLPTESYFADVKLFDDLPTITNCPGVKEKVFLALGVRKTVDLETIFKRLLNPSETGERTSKWSNVDLISYLASVRADIPASDMTKLKSTPICTSETDSSTTLNGSVKRYKLSELFEPQDKLRQLGLPILQWQKGKGQSDYDQRSREGRFLSILGLRSYPSVPELVNLMASDDLTMRLRARNYYIAHYDLNKYGSFDLNGAQRPFLPIQGNEKKLALPVDLCTNESAALLGFQILSSDLTEHASKFGVHVNPPIADCAARLIAKPPRSNRDARSLFSYFSSRIPEISKPLATKLGDAKFVPVHKQSSLQSSSKLNTPEAKQIIFSSPNKCFLGNSETYHDIFDFVDFGDANIFLLHCGSKHEPSKTEVATMLATSPAHVLGIVGSSAAYLNLLRTVADSAQELKKDKALFNMMKTSPFLIAERIIPSVSEKSIANDAKKDDVEDDEESHAIVETVLQPAQRIVVTDDYRTYRLFRNSLLTAPEDQTLEKFYLALGSSLLSSLLVEDVRPSAELDSGGEEAARLHTRLIERARLFMHDIAPKDSKQDSKWVEKSLKVKLVGRITSRKSLHGYTISHSTEETATIGHVRQQGWILFITPKYDTWQVSVALVNQLLNKPSTQYATVLDFVLNAKLETLRRRGYNVARILKAQADNFRIAEEERRKQLEAEQARMRDEELKWKQSQPTTVPVTAREEQPRSPKQVMPGSFGDDSGGESPPVERKRGLLSGITRRLGINSSGEAQQQLQNFFTGHETPQDQETLPPSYDESNKQITKGPSGGRQPGQTERVTSPVDVHQNLVNAIQSSRAHGSTTLFSPPQTRQVKEQASYCDETHSHNLAQVGETRNSIPIFVDKNLSVSPAIFLNANATGLNTFAGILQDICIIYSLPPKGMHLFYDEAGSTIAFNRAGSIFCNYRFFKQLHLNKMETKAADATVEAAAWWWIVIAHELAHNIVADHSAEHSYYTEMFLAQYFVKMMKKTIEYGQNISVRQVNAKMGSQNESLLD